MLFGAESVNFILHRDKTMVGNLKGVTSYETLNPAISGQLYATDRAGDRSARLEATDRPGELGDV